MTQTVIEPETEQPLAELGADAPEAYSELKNVFFATEA